MAMGLLSRLEYSKSPVSYYCSLVVDRVGSPITTSPRAIFRIDKKNQKE
jgi:hypothetical protein